jgi:hypothetical protein
LTASKAIIIAPSPWTLEAGPGSRTMSGPKSLEIRLIKQPRGC